MGLGLGCDNLEFFCRGGGGRGGAWLAGGEGGLEIRVTNCLAHFTASLRADFEVEKNV